MSVKETSLIFSITMYGFECIESNDVWKRSLVIPMFSKVVESIFNSNLWLFENESSNKLYHMSLLISFALLKLLLV